MELNADSARRLLEQFDFASLFIDELGWDRHSAALPIETPQSPFATKVKNQGVTTWVKPKLVAEIRFTEWTTAGEMRHPVFLGLRTDKRAEDVVLETELKRRPK